MALSPGFLLDGYEILAPLGSGGMGDVYRARDRNLKREVAIKVLPTSVSNDQDRLRRFEQEAQAAAALNHPNILAVYRFGVFEGAPYLVSELLEGSTLRQLEERGPLPVRKAIEVGVQIAQGLAAAHEIGILHRDLKPENLFVTKDGRARILDFGLAKLLQTPTLAASDGPTQAAGTEPGMVLGTAGYMAPEQVRGLLVDHRTDIFSFGVVLYEMLTGRRAFQRSTTADTIAAVLHEEPQSISAITPATPLGLQRVVQRCLEKNPEQRFQSASDLAFALQSLADSGAYSANSGFTMPGPPQAGRKRLAWFAVPALLLLLAAAWFVRWYQFHRSLGLSISSYTQLTHNGHAGSIIGTDGTRIYANHGVDYPITQVAISGGEVEQLPLPIPLAFALDLSPDGSTLLAYSMAAGSTTTYPIYSVQLLGGSKRYLAQGTNAVWAPDGKSVFYFTPDGMSHRIQADGSGDEKFMQVGDSIDSFSWSPDRRLIRYFRKNELWEMSADGSNAHELLRGWHPKKSKCCGSWSPDGSTYLFLSGPGSQIWAQGTQSGLWGHSAVAPIQLTSGPTSWSSAIFSKDGKTIFASGYVDHGELVRLNLQTKQLEPFMGGVSGEFVSFSADKQTVAYVSYPESILWKAEADGGGAVQLTNPPMAPRLASISPDGTQVVFVDDSAAGVAQTWIVSTQGGAPRRLLPQDAGSETDPNWSPDGKRLSTPQVKRPAAMEIAPFACLMLRRDA